MEKKIIHLLQKEVDLEHIPGGALYISYRGKTMVEVAVGYRARYPKKEALNINTIFDLASLTKVIATMPAILMLLDAGEIHLHDKVSYFLKAFEKDEKTNITIEQLLTHTSGLPAHRPYFKNHLTVEQMIDQIGSEQLEYPIGEKVVYSDLGFILLMKLVEQIATTPFEEFVKSYILKPLDMHETGFNPTFDRMRFAPTTYADSIKDYKYGIVHDENAESMGGVSGHAGLFSTLKDLAHFALMVENKGQFENRQIISEQSMELSKRHFTPFSDERRGLGWQLYSRGLSCGDLFSPLSYGHTGFTGTSIWFDPTIDLHVIFLTNRVHGNNQQAIQRLRPCLHNVIRSYFK